MSARTLSAFSGCYDARRAAALAGVPASTVYDWARKGVVAPSVSLRRPKLWSYADLMALRIVYWLRHPKNAGAGLDLVPASPMHQVRAVLEQLDQRGIDLWSLSLEGHSSPLVVDRTGRLFYPGDDGLQDYAGTSPLSENLLLDVLGPFDIEEGSTGPDLRQPRPHLRIVPGKVSGEPHLEHSRLTTVAVASLAESGYSVADISALYPHENAQAIAEAIDLEKSLVA